MAYSDYTFNPVTPTSNYTEQAAPRGGMLGSFGAAMYGSKPGQVHAPNPYYDLANVMPSLPALNSAASGALGDQLSGSVDTNYLRNLAANLGVTTGIGAGGATPSGFVNNSMLVNGMLYRDKKMNEGLQNYSRLIPTVSQTQTVSPALQLENAWWNSTNAAAPDPGVSGLKNDTMELIGGFLGAI